jgi:hypothetical protein
MLLNVMNSADLNLLLGYFDCFATRTCKSIETYIMDQSIGDSSSVKKSEVINSVEISSPQNIAYYLAQMHMIFPDLVMRLQSNEIFQRENMPGCEIRLHHECKATQLLNNFDLNIAAFTEPHDDGSSFSPFQPSCSSNDSLRDETINQASYLPASNAPTSLLHNPMEFICSTFGTLSINEDNKITCFDVRIHFQVLDSQTKKPLDKVHLSLMQNLLRVNIA